MRNGFIGFALTMLLVNGNANAQQDDYGTKALAYVEQYKSLAIAEQKRSGIPAAITLAQGIHETSAGTSELATMANNHFGIKCKKEWSGETFAHTDDAPNECFRKYTRAEDSYKDHSDYLVKSPRYAELFKLSATDYAAWALGLKRCGYATNPRYAQVLIKLVEDYHLQEYTYAALNNTDYTNNYVASKAEVVPEHDAPKPVVAHAVITQPATTAVQVPPIPTSTTPPAIADNTSTNQSSGRIVVDNNKVDEAVKTAELMPEYGQIVKVNGIKAIYGRKGDTPLEYAYKGDVRYSKFLEVNEIDERPLPVDMYLYLEKKNTRGTRPIHTVKPGENLFLVSQAEGIQIKSLIDMNMLEPGEEPVSGTVLALQKTVSKKPTVTRIKKEPATVVEPTQTNIQKPVVVASASVPTKQPANSNIKVSDEVKPKPVVVQPKAEPVALTTPVEKQTIVATDTPVNPQIELLKENKLDKASEVVAQQTEDKTTTPVTASPSIGPASPPEVAAATKTEEKTTTNMPPAPTPEPVKEETRSVIIDPVATVEPMPIQNTPAVEVKKEEVVINKVSEPEVKREEEPVDELDRLKKKFDKVVYAKPAATAPAPATTPQQPKSDVTTVKTESKNEGVEQQKKPLLTASKDPAKFYTVKRGDTGHSIAKSHHITLKQLMDWNNLDFDDIQEGQKLRIKP